MITIKRLRGLLAQCPLDALLYAVDPARRPSGDCGIGIELPRGGTLWSGTREDDEIDTVHGWLYSPGGMMHWSEWLIIISSVTTTVFILRTMRFPLRRLGRWKYREEWIIVGLLVFIIILTITIATMRS